MKFFINCLKPPGMTSHDVVAYIRRLLQIRKVGHTGTLDPGATGVLPIAVGNATRAIEYLDADKKYRCEAILGFTTTTQDLFGKVVTGNGCTGITEDLILEHINKFIGTIEQTPPMYSAVKVKGKKLYNIARKGNVEEVPSKKVRIKELKVINIKKQNNNFILLFDVFCEKGTYVRTICHDLGLSLGCGGTMSFLIRTQAGPFSINNAFTLEELQDINHNISRFTIPINSVLDGQLNSIKINNLQLNKYINGVAIPITESEIIKTNQVITENLLTVVIAENNEFIGIGELIFNHNETLLKAKKLLL